jgi:hypothetical protein
MSASPEPPERLAEILLEILALSNSARATQAESDRGIDPIESFDAHSVEDQSQQRTKEKIKAQRS